MNVGYVDTSCLVAVAFGEPGHEAIVARLQIVDGPEGLAGAALVIEAVAEDLAVKQSLFAAVERAVVMSTGSGLSVM